MTPRPLPPELRGAAIRTSTSAEHDLGRSRLRARDVQHPFRGVSASGFDLAVTRDLCRAFEPVLEDGQTFSHTTSLALQGAPLPASDPVLHISVAFPRTPPRRPGVRGHSLSRNPTSLLDGMPVTPAVEAWAQSSTILSREDLVAVGDHLLVHGVATLEELASRADAWERRPGSARVQWAAERVRRGVRSRPETLLRLLLVRARLPEPEVAYPVTVAGGLVLHPDLAYPGHRIAIEYEGDGHRSPRQWELDIERRELLAEAGWRTIRVTKTQLFEHPQALVTRVRRHLGR